MRPLIAWIAIAASACAPRAPSVDPGWIEPAIDGAATDATSTDGVLVTAASGLGRPCETIAIIDLHSRAGDEATGFDELRRWAGTMAADAVVSARYEAANAGEAAHVSGVVVRFKVADPRPYDVLAEVEVRSEEDVPDKGLEALRAKARELGADKVVDVRFQHSEAGLSRLRGLAVRYRR